MCLLAVTVCTYPNFKEMDIAKRVDKNGIALVVVVRKWEEA